MALEQAIKMRLLADVNNVPARRLAELVITEDCTIEEYLAHNIDPRKLDLVKKEMATIPHPQESGDWQQCVASRDISQVRQYVAHCRSGRYKSNHTEADTLYEELQKVLEHETWAVIDRGSIDALASFVGNFPNSGYRPEAEALLLDLERKRTEESDWTAASMANRIEDYVAFTAKHPMGPYTHEAKQRIEGLKQMELQKMRTNPNDYTKLGVATMLSSGTFTEDDLIRGNVLTKKAIDHIMGRGLVPKDPDQTTNSIPESPPRNTDIFFFGLPTSGKTCVLAGMFGYAGESDKPGVATLDFDTLRYGGSYAESLQSFVFAGVIPPGTKSEYVNLFDANVKSQEYQHNISLIEMSGEEVVFKIARNDNFNNSFKISDMGNGAAELLNNNNRKVIFFIIDPSRDGLLKIGSETFGSELIVSQPQVLKNIIDLLAQPENEKVLKLTDTIHFIMTKSDTLPCHESDRGRMASDIMHKSYGPVIKSVKRLCKTYEINVNYGGRPRVYPFSLGRFMIGGNFEYESDDAQKIISVIRSSTESMKEKTFLSSVMDFFNKEI